MSKRRPPQPPSSPTPATVERAIAAVVATLKHNSGSRLGEQNTKASLIEPMIEALGWDVRDPKDVFREYKTTSLDRPVDYALMVSGQKPVILEAKGLGEDLSDRRWTTQILGYAAVEGVKWCILTNGDDYRFYNAGATVDADAKLFWQMRLSETPMSQAAAVMTLFSRASVRDGVVDAAWNVRSTDLRVADALRSLIRETEPGLIRLLQKRARAVDAKAVEQSLRRLDASIAAAPPTWRANHSERASGGPELAELIKSGALQARLPLSCTYRGRKIVATLKEDGTVELAGKSYPTPSAAGSAARAAVTGKPMATNGWEFWSYLGKDGKLRKLAEARGEPEKRIGR